MEKILKPAGLLLVTIFLPQVSFAGQAASSYQNAQGASFQESQAANAGEEPPDIRVDKLSRELERNKELLEIWKDHVRTLTQERDEAYKQIEDLKTGAGAPLRVNLEEKIQELKKSYTALDANNRTQTERLKTEIQSLNSQAAEETKKFEALSAEKQNLNDQIRILQTKVEALQADSQQADVLKQQLGAALSEKQAQIQSLKSDLDHLRVENQKVEGLAQKLKEFSAKAGELDRMNVQLKSENKKIIGQNQNLQAQLKVNLQANLSDIKNLRANFGSYLESLERSVDERQKRETQGSAS